MKTSVIEVRDMLSVLSVVGVEKLIGEVPGVESVTVNYAAGSATVRYDETRLEIADIKSAARQSGYESAEPTATAGDDHEGRTAQGAPPETHAPAAPNTPPAAPPTLPASASAAPQSTPNAVSAAPASAVPAGDGQQHKAASGKH